MIFSINKQAVEIKTRFEHAQLTSKYEVVAAIGMITKIYGLSLPSKKETLDEMRNDLHTFIDKVPVPSDYVEKLISLLDFYGQKAEVTDEMYDLLKYSYNDQT